MNPIYITTTLPYVNADPHIGFALEVIRADVLARYHRARGHEVFFNTGTDEHGQKIFEKATAAGEDVQAYVDKYAAKFKELKPLLNITPDNFIRTTDEHHVKAAQEFWRRCEANGDIYKAEYETMYCVGCELEKQLSDLDEEGCCPLHPGVPLQKSKEENYFFRFSKYEDKLLELYEDSPNFVLPQTKFNEIKSFVEAGLKDFSISRRKEKMTWGIPVPGDDTHVMYVWFDALVNYVSAIGYPNDQDTFKKWWPVIQFAGKDNLRQQSAMWQAMLMSAGLEPSRQICIHEFINVNGQKMSKSIGNVISPVELVEKYGIDAVRYFFLREFSYQKPSDFSYEKFETRYTSDLVNGIGNTLSRLVALTHKYFDGEVRQNLESGIWNLEEFWREYDEKIALYSYDEVLKLVWEIVRSVDELIEKNELWNLCKSDAEKAGGIIYEGLETLRILTCGLEPFIPDAAGKIYEQLGFEVSNLNQSEESRSWGGLKDGQKLAEKIILFPRLEKK